MDKKEKDAIDLEFLKSLIGDDEAFRRELFSLFLESAKKNIAQLESSANSGDKNSWYMAAHALKGASSSIGAFFLKDALELAQKASEEGKEKKLEILRKVKEEFAAVKNLISLAEEKE